MRHNYPFSILQSLRVLFFIDSESLISLVNRLEEIMPITQSPQEWIHNFLLTNEVVSDFSREGKLALSDAIINVHVLAAGNGYDGGDISEEFFGLCKDDSNLELDEKLFDGWKKGFEKILSSKVLRASIKSLNLSIDRDKVYLGSRILTDFRPVYDDGDIQNPLLASLVLHTLKLSVQNDGNVNSIYVALDTRDLYDLKLVIERAIKKAEFSPMHIKGAESKKILGTEG